MVIGMAGKQAYYVVFVEMISKIYNSYTNCNKQVVRNRILSISNFKDDASA
ncbi:hypothetical protein HYC85_026479 [Camellia sinensis]|uniref:Uncharacterized protein n=1 Tax=Camellia sinensis TaxID=4442 RepID=A0A7J7G3P5_CAMSI|nr:hypothetical protein HYC85_026479 [Camellia sinensis]